MISPDYARVMARYNHWQNENLIRAADGVGDDARRRDRGAFFGSIFGTFNHLLWGDQRWMARFTGGEAPDWPQARSSDYAPDWETFLARRRETDRVILEWSETVTSAWLESVFSWRSGAAGGAFARPFALLTAHFFNHQTHHRGQIHAMLTAAGARPEDTDLLLLP